MSDELAIAVSKKTTIRYTVARSLIAFVLVASFLLLSRQLKLNEHDGEIINISGQQRMLSQRIGLMLHELVGESDPVLADQYSEALEADLDQMQRNHALLVDGKQASMSSTLHELYFGEVAVDRDVRNYMMLAANLLAASRDESQTNEVRSRLRTDLVSIARKSLLARLDRVVLQYQKEYEAKVAWFRQAEQLCLFVGLLVLAMEAVLIFRPMTQAIATNVGQLSAANEELREFAYRVSHDVRAPIKSSMGLTELIQDSIADGDLEFAADATQRVHQSMVKLDQLICDVVAVTKIKNVEVELEPVDLSKLVSEIIDDISSLPVYDRVSVRTDILINQPLMTKRVFLEQTLVNLISNGFKYHDPEKPQPALLISAAIVDGECAIHVTDNGLGIPERCRDEVFGMFKRFHPRQSFGSGLGLYLVKQNVARLEGRLRYEPLPDGSRFSVNIPV